jgi:hypothetical protein
VSLPSVYWCEAAADVYKEENIWQSELDCRVVNKMEQEIAGPP